MGDYGTYLYFDSYWQGIQLFIQFFEDDQLFQCEAAEPVGKEKNKRGGEKKKHISDMTNTMWAHLHDKL